MGDIHPNHIRPWLNSPEKHEAPEKFQEKAKEICSAYQNAPKAREKGEYVMSVDEMTAIQALERKAPTKPVIPGKPSRVEFEYIRHPDKYVFTYQGDGDLASIGTAETMHACNRGENIVIIFINNAIYGMTGGQMAPTTLLGQVTATTPYGRKAELNGYPLKITELLAQLEGTCYVTRQSVQNPAAVRKTRAAIKKAFQNSMMKKGTSFVEVVSTCNSGWKIPPVEANKWMEENMFPFYPLGDMKDR